MSIFEERKNLRPYQYPHLYEYNDAVRHSYWVHTEFNFTGDVQNFKVDINDAEREAMTRTMLAIAQIEVAVKNFWGDVGKHLPKPEIAAVGMTFAESEVRHADAYAHLLETLNLNHRFETLLEVPAMGRRFDYLSTVSKLSKTKNPQDYTKAIILFSILIEHVSLFSQFLIMMSFNKHKNLFKGTSNAVEATSKEENIHGLFGIDLVNIIRKENPEWFTKEFEDEIHEFCEEAWNAECEVLDWIFENGELEFLPKAVIKEFIKSRMDKSIMQCGFGSMWVVDEEILEETEWFENNVIASSHVDFFDKRSVNYNKRSQSVTTDDLF